MRPQKPPLTAGHVRGAVETVVAGPITSVTPLAGGEWSAAFRATGPGVDVVVRVAYQREDFDRDRAAAAWAGPDLPVPEVLELCPLEDAWVAVTPYVDGSALDLLDAADLNRTLPSLLRALDALRRVEPPGGGYGVWAAGGGAPHATWSEALLAVAVDGGSRIRGWRAALDTLDRAGAVFDAGVETLRSVAGAYDGPRRVVHGDLLAGNVLTVDGEVTAVLDWGCSMYGDPLFDAAMLIFWQPWHPAGRDLGLDRALVAHHAGAARLEERLLACQLHIGLAAMAYSAFSGRSHDALACAREVELLS